MGDATAGSQEIETRHSFFTMSAKSSPWRRKMAAVSKDEESLLPSGRESEDFSRGFAKPAKWQGGRHSFNQCCSIRTAVTAFMVLVTVIALLWMLYV